MSIALARPQLKSAVLVAVDVQVGFVKESSQHVVSVIADLMRAWQAAGGATAIATFTNPPGSQYEKISGWTKLRTPEEQALAPELALVADAASERIAKTTSSFFKVPGVLDTFRARGWTAVVLVGIDTDSCVHDSATDAYQYGITPWIVTDACASSGGSKYHQAALLLAARNFGAHLLLTSSDLHHMLAQGGSQ